jgi:uncharacterized protein YjiS (DUF1127 family)
MSLNAVPAAREPTASRPGRGVRGSVMLAVARLLCWHELARQRRALLRLDDRMLKDIGITRTDAEHEAGRPFWDDPLDPWSTRRR